MLDRLMRALRSSLPYLAVLIALVWMGNFFWFVAESQQLGGSALNGGFVRDGHYFLALHGTSTEVTRAVWERVRLHELTVLVTLPLAVASMGYWLFGFLFPKLMRLRQGPVVDGRAQSVRTSGERLASGRCSGSIGGVSLGWPFLSVEIYPGGILIRTFPGRTATILTEELRRVEWQHRGNQVLIAHSSPDFTSPILLYVASWMEIGAGLKQLVPDLNLL
jgi:hypothetical protein